MLRNLHDRFTPPLPTYLAALSLMLFGDSTWALRLPFAMCGLGCVMLMLSWLGREKAAASLWMLFGLALLGSVSFFLYFRQCRYYAAVMLASTWLVKRYVFCDRKRSSLVGTALLSVALLASSYLNYAALYLCLAVDYWIWGRRQRALKLGDWIALLLPQLILGGIVVLIWNPFQTENAVPVLQGGIIKRLQLIWWNFRDFCECEMGICALLIVAPFLSWKGRQCWLARASLAFSIYLVFVSLVSPHPITNESRYGEVRYLCPLIPLCLVIGVFVIHALTEKTPSLAMPLALLAFGTNLLSGFPLFKPPSNVVPHKIRSSVFEYSRELISPPSDPYTVAARWINQHVKTGESIWVLPDYMAHPLIYHAPVACYAWQLDNPPADQFKRLPLIHFRGAQAPDYMIAFGPIANQLPEILREWNAPGISYSRIETLNYYWHDVHRPELYLRMFRSVTDFDRTTDAIYIFQRKMAAGI